MAGVNLLKVKEVAPMLHKILMETDFNPSLILNIFFHQFLWPLQLLTS